MCPLFREFGHVMNIKGHEYSKSHATLVYLVQQAKTGKLRELK